MTREQFLAMIESSPNKINLMRDYDRQERERIEAIPDVPIYPKGVKGEEKFLQSACEGYLRQRGYRPSTAAEVVASVKEGASEVKGWYIHLHNCERNPLMSDLIIMDEPMRRCLCIELKVRSSYTPGQKEFIDRKCWHECRSFLDFKTELDDWEINR